MTQLRLSHCELLELHATPKFLADVAAEIVPGNHLEMEGAIDPCRAGCCPAIRSFVHTHQCSAEYKSAERTFVFRTGEH
jgi:hypothetical protein